MQDYSKLYAKKYQSKKSCRMICQIKRLVEMQLPPDVLLLLIMAVIYPVQMAQQLIRR